jgi:hypothetical protein
MSVRGSWFPVPSQPLPGKGPASQPSKLRRPDGLPRTAISLALYRDSQARWCW